MNSKIKQIEFMEKSIGSIFKQEFWSPEIVNTIESFKFVVNNNLVEQISNIMDEDYKYTHEAILSKVNTHGLFQFTLNMPESASSGNFKADLLSSYDYYLEDRILSSFESLKTHEAIVVTLDLFVLLYCHITIANIYSDIKDVMIRSLKKIVSLYEHYNGTDELSIMLLSLQENIHKGEEDEK